MTQITTLGVALAKEVMVVCAADQAGRTVYFRQFSCVIRTHRFNYSGGMGEVTKQRQKWVQLYLEMQRCGPRVPTVRDFPTDTLEVGSTV